MRKIYRFLSSSPTLSGEVSRLARCGTVNIEIAAQLADRGGGVERGAIGQAAYGQFLCSLTSGDSMSSSNASPCSSVIPLKGCALASRVGLRRYVA